LVLCVMLRVRLVSEPHCFLMFVEISDDKET